MIGPMPGESVDASKLFGVRPLGPLRDKRTVDISASDHTDEGGFVCQAGAAGDLTYRTLGGTEQTETLEAGGSVNVGGVMVLLDLVRASATVRSIVVGKL